MEMGFNDIAMECLDLQGYDRDLPVEQRMADFDWAAAAACASKGRVAMYMADNEATHIFLEKNPQFRYPGGSNGNLNPCWGQNRTYLTGNGGC